MKTAEVLSSHNVTNLVKRRRIVFSFFFFFQAEDGIRDLTVTGVQTCALPILRAVACRSPAREPERALLGAAAAGLGAGGVRRRRVPLPGLPLRRLRKRHGREIGRASYRERV